MGYCRGIAVSCHQMLVSEAWADVHVQPSTRTSPRWHQPLRVGRLRPVPDVRVCQGRAGHGVRRVLRWVAVRRTVLGRMRDHACVEVQ